MQKRVSLKDIAAKAGVSAALVSYVLNNRLSGRISVATAQKIRDIAGQLNYSTNQLAKSLKTNKTNTIGLIVADISNPFSANLARIIEDEAEKCQYTTIFGSSDEDPGKFDKLVHTMLNRKVDGLILSPPAKSEAVIESLQQKDIPIVLLDRYFPGIKTSYVIIDNFAASMEAVHHLLSTGRTRIGMITYDSELQHLLERKNGYIRALENNGVRVEKEWLQLVGIENNQQQIEDAVRALLSATPAVDAVLFGSNKIATSSLKLINSLSLRVPCDLAVICFDHTEMLDLFYSPVTYIKQPLEEIGELAVSYLLSNLLYNGTISTSQLKASLVIQQSTSRPDELYQAK
ncbi:LacI family DNA-binding transcriptional regulator [Ferruginibacter paludis]|uniref:LacI family DNA-binding transcriptional regulator n=1 Tax=Ferruginibacter paludis TaxID=1310417 RepID=UPI0025B4AFCF|nr:LacI family DNA-binding transcriptional regulator [Ferruginibacter paludis]MDN3657919.1 LacI family DNA-binding transcriptional regulator [Ferruginibacter paludis]